jgi:hypothetical protein
MYITVQEFKDYHDARANDYTILDTDSKITSAILKASDWLNNKSWMGERTDPTQTDAFPRDYLWYDNNQLDDNTTPTQIKNACAELALIQATQEMYQDFSGDEVKREKVSSLEVEYKDGSNRGVQPIFGAVQALINPFVISTNCVMRK